MEMPQRNPLQQLGHLVQLYSFYLRLYFRTLVEYRADTWITMITGLITQVGSLAFVGVLFHRIPKLAGWGFYELIFIFAFSVTVKGLSEVFLNASFSINGIIRRGTLDIFLVRPVGPLFQAIGVCQEMNGMGPALTGMIIMVYAAQKLHLVWTLGNILFTVVALLSGMFIYFCMLMFASIMTFWIVEVRNVIYPIAWFFDFTRYPLEVFHPVVRTVLIYFIPYAMGSFYPAAYLLRPANYAWAVWAVPLFTLSLFSLMYGLWSMGLKRYSSAV